MFNVQKMGLWKGEKSYPRIQTYLVFLQEGLISFINLSYYSFAVTSTEGLTCTAAFGLPQQNLYSINICLYSDNKGVGTLCRSAKGRDNVLTCSPRKSRILWWGLIINNLSIWMHGFFQFSKIPTYRTVGCKKSWRFVIVLTLQYGSNVNVITSIGILVTKAERYYCLSDILGYFKSIKSWYFLINHRDNIPVHYCH